MHDPSIVSVPSDRRLRRELPIAEAHAAHRDARAALLGAQGRVHAVDLEAPRGAIFFGLFRCKGTTNPLENVGKGGKIKGTCGKMSEKSRKSPKNVREYEENMRRMVS